MPRHSIVLALFLTLFPLFTAAQAPTLKLPEFSHLQAKATDSVDITIGPMLLGLARFALDHDDDPESAEVREVLKSIKSIQVRSYEFSEDFVYSEADIEAVRKQLQQPGWSQLAQVRSRKKHESVDIYISLEDTVAKGFALIASEPRQFTIINIVGPIDLAKLEKLEAHLGLPKVELETASVSTASAE